MDDFKGAAKAHIKEPRRSRELFFFFFGGGVGGNDRGSFFFFFRGGGGIEPNDKEFLGLQMP